MTGALSFFRFRDKILVSFLLLTVVPLALLGLFSATNSMRTIRRETDRYIDHILNQSIASISYKLNEVVSTAEYVVTNEEMQSILRRTRVGYQSDGRQLDDYATLQNNLLAIESNELIESARLYLQSPTLYTNARVWTFPIAEFPKPEILGSPHVRYSWYTTILHKMSYAPQPAIAVAAPIVDLRDVRNRLAGIEIICNMRLLSAAFEGTLLADGGFAVIASSLQVILTHPADLALEHDSVQGCIVAGGTGSAVVDGEQYRVARLGIPRTPWTAYMFIPFRQIAVGTRQIALFSVALTLVIIVADIVAAFFLSTLISRRLQSLVESMKKTSAGEHRQPVPVTGNDEITVLEQEYNSMIDAIDALFQRVNEAAERRRVAEYKALESQINPHFLYNMLEGIKWLGLRGRKQEMVEVIETMSDLFRYNLSKGREVVTIEEELESICKYVRLQNMRYGHTISIEIDVPHHLLSEPIIKLLFQPIVENAIVHGIQKKPSRRGIVGITVREDDGTRTIVIRDNGVGMDDQTSKTVTTAESAGYGLRNVVQRMKFYYGSPSGVSIESAPGLGTAVTLVIAKRPISHDNR
jgi:two-component system sensor histidine kinase YesM